MPKVKGKYETLFIIDTTLTEEAIAETVTKFKSIIETNGTIENVDEWGKRRMAYKINDMAEGYYVLVNFESSPEFPAELDRIYKITDGIIRSMIIAKN